VLVCVRACVRTRKTHRQKDACHSGLSVWSRRRPMTKTIEDPVNTPRIDDVSVGGRDITEQALGAKSMQSTQMNCKAIAQ